MGYIGKDQRGLALPLIIAIVVAVLAIAGGTYYFLNKNGDSGTTAVNKQAEDECKKSIEDKDLCKLASTYDPNGQYTVAMTSTTDGQAVLMTIRLSGGNYHSTTEVAGQPTAEMIHLDGATYMKDPDSGNWMKYPTSTDETGDAFAPELDFDEADIPNYTAKGKEACGDLTCFRYDFADPEIPNSAFSIWFDDNEYKIRKISSSGSEGDVEMVYTYGDVTITAPENYTEFPTPDAGAGAPTEAQLDALRQQFSQ